MNLQRSALFLLSAALLCGCPAEAGEVGDLPGSTEGGETSGNSGADPEASSSTTDDASGSSDASTSGAPPADSCEDGGFGCCIDVDGDGVPLGEDVSPEYPDPAQGDMDSDGFGDAIDLCPLVPDETGTNTADSDRDGIGNACDLCADPVNEYNAGFFKAAVPDYMLVRNLPTNADFDGDGVGDSCDNCPTVPNCNGFGEDVEFDGVPPEVGGAECQTDANSNGIGDACEGLQGPLAAGPVGFGDQDDFDGDGLINALDACPRLPLPTDPLACTPETAEADCGADTPCSPAGVCNHVDSDGDGIGDACDTCAYQPNPSQAMEGGAQDDDADGDAVGEVCELGADQGCGDRSNARRIAYHPVSSLGLCCTVQLVADSRGDLFHGTDCGDPESDANCIAVVAPSPDDPGTFIPVRASCEGADGTCAELPAHVAATPGVLSLPPGCESALGAAGLTEADNRESVVTEESWLHACKLPQLDVDFDGIGDACDRCPTSWDPTNEPYTDESGMLWPNDGAACNGAYVCE